MLIIKRFHNFLCSSLDYYNYYRFVFHLAEEFCQSSNAMTKTFVVCVGRQPNSDVWVLDPDLHIDGRGRVIPKCDQSFFW